MRMPFERLMEHVAALSDEDKGPADARAVRALGCAVDYFPHNGRH